MSLTAPPHPLVRGAGARALLQGDQRIVVIGAGGWLGLATLEMLHGLFGETFERRVAAYGSSERTLSLRGGVDVPQWALAELAKASPVPTLVLHLAYLTQERAAAMTPAHYAETNRAISRQVLDALDPLGAEAIFVASSGAVYLADDNQALASKRLYGSLKLEDEARFADWATRRGRRAAVARMFNLSGPYINKRSSYALACFIADALAGRPITIQAARRVYRSYVAIEDLMSVVFGVLTELGGRAITFDTAGDAVYEMAQIAEAVLETLGCARRIERPALGDEEPDRYVGDRAAYVSLLGRLDVEPLGFADQIKHTAGYMAEYP